jgi:hypothetical protein
LLFGTSSSVAKGSDGKCRAESGHGRTYHRSPKFNYIITYPYTSLYPRNSCCFPMNYYMSTNQFLPLPPYTPLDPQHLQAFLRRWSSASLCAGGGREAQSLRLECHPGRVRLHHKEQNFGPTLLKVQKLEIFRQKSAEFETMTRWLVQRPWPHPW